MSLLSTLLTDARFAALVLALLHTLWMGAVAAAGLALVLRWLPASRVTLRYSLSLVALGGIVLATGVAWVGLDRIAAESPMDVVPSGNRVGTLDPLPSLGSERVPASEMAAGDPTSRPAAAVTDGVPGSRRWVPYVGALWMLGVAVMLVRTAAAVRQAGQLVRRSQRVDAATLALVDGLRRQLGMVRHVRVAVSEFCSSPAVAGVIWPTLVLPVSFLTQLPPDAIRAILLHELAHVRRHDYLVNLLQMLVEAILFFNPAVWWISRQVRLEREACCDAVAVRASGQPVEYSRALADWAWRMQQASYSASQPSAAMGVLGRPQPLLFDRIRRVLLPSERPATHLAPRSLATFALMAMLTFGLLWQGPWVAVAVAEQLLSPAERVEQVAKVVEANSPPQRSEGDARVTLIGRVRTEDGQPLPKGAYATSASRRENKSAVESIGEIKETFEVKVSPGVIWLQVRAKGYAPGIAGPFRGEAGGVIDGIEVVLPKGFPVEFLVTDEEGSGVEGAKVFAGLLTGDMSSISLRATSGVRGSGVLKNIIEGEYTVSARAPGFQNLGSARRTVRRGEPLPIVLKRSRPVTGEVVSVDGQAIAGAKIQAFVTIEGENNRHIYGPTGEQLGATGADGRFALDELVNHHVYHVMVSHPDHGRRVVEGLRPGDRDVRIELGPPLVLEGSVHGDLSRLPQTRGKPYVKLRQKVSVGADKTEGWYGDTATVEPSEEGGRFVFAGVLPAETVVTAGEHQVKLEVSQPRQQVVVDLAEPAPTAEQRTVELLFAAEEGALPRGSVEIFATTLERRVFEHYRDVALREGRARFEVPVGVEVRVEPNGLVGYWFKATSFTIASGEQPHEVRIDTVAAGAISGRVVLPDGTPASGASIGIRAIAQREGLENESITPNVGGRVDAKGRLILTPLPLGATYVVTAGTNFNKAVSEPVRLTPESPTAAVELKFAPETSAAGVVVGPDGQPLADIPLQLVLEHPLASTSWGPGFFTDSKGRFEVHGLSSALEGYRVRLNTNKKYQPASASLSPGGSPATLELTEGLVLEGRVIDAETGKPIAGVELYAVATQRLPDEPYAYEPEGETAADGSFRFSNLAPRPYQINDRSGLTWDKEAARRVVPEEGVKVVIEATLPEWSRLKVGE